MEITLERNRECCLCLQPIQEEDLREEEQKSNARFLGNICRFLKINLSEVLRQGWEREAQKEDRPPQRKEGRGRNLSGSLCQSCGSVTRKLSTLIEELEGLQRKVGFYSEQFQGILEKGDLTRKGKVCRGMADPGVVQHLKEETPQRGSDPGQDLTSSPLPEGKLTRLKEETIPGWKRKCTITPAVAGADVVTIDGSEDASPSLQVNGIPPGASGTLPVAVAGKNEIGATWVPLVHLEAPANDSPRLLQSLSSDHATLPFPCPSTSASNGDVVDPGAFSVPPTCNDPPPAGFQMLCNLLKYYFVPHPSAVAKYQCVLCSKEVQNKTFTQISHYISKHPETILAFAKPADDSDMDFRRACLQVFTREVDKCEEQPARNKEGVITPHRYKYVCYICQGILPDLQHLKYHMLKVHVAILVQGLGELPENFPTDAALRRRRKRRALDHGTIHENSDSFQVEDSSQGEGSSSQLSSGCHPAPPTRHPAPSGKPGGVRVPELSTIAPIGMREPPNDVFMNQLRPGPPYGCPLCGEVIQRPLLPELGNHLTRNHPEKLFSFARQVHVTEEMFKRICVQLLEGEAAQCEVGSGGGLTPYGVVTSYFVYYCYICKGTTPDRHILKDHLVLFHADLLRRKLYDLQKGFDHLLHYGHSPGTYLRGETPQYSNDVASGSSAPNFHHVYAGPPVNDRGQQGHRFYAHGSTGATPPIPTNAAGIGAEGVRVPLCDAPPTLGTDEGPTRKRKRQHSGVCPHCHQSIPSKKQQGELHTLRFHPEQLFLPFKPAHRSLSDFKASCVHILNGEVQGWSPPQPCPYCPATLATYRQKINYLRHLAYDHQESLGEKIKGLRLVPKEEVDHTVPLGKPADWITWPSTMGESIDNMEELISAGNNMGEDNREDEDQERLQ